MDFKETKTYRKFRHARGDNFPEWIIGHHTGGTSNPRNDLADTSHHTASGIEAGHLSLGWDGLGYQFVIHKDGEIWRGRPEHYHGAHTKEKNMNTESIGICLAGNFDVTEPTEEQISSLKWLIKYLQDKYDIDNEHIVPHRKYATYKSCYGKKLSDDWMINFNTQDTEESGEEVDEELEEDKPVVSNKEETLTEVSFLEKLILRIFNLCLTFLKKRGII